MELTSPMKNQSGLFATKYSQESGLKRPATGTAQKEAKRRLEFNTPRLGSTGAGGAQATDGVPGNPKFDTTRRMIKCRAVEIFGGDYWNTI